MVDHAALARRWAPTLGATIVPPPRITSDQQPPQEAAPQVAGPPHTGVMVAFYPTREQAAQLAIEGGEAVEELHLTLAYLGTVGQEVPEDGESALIGVVSEWATQQQPVTATINGLGLFTGGPTPVTYANVDAPDLAATRQSLVQALDAHGTPAVAEHGYTPHMTLIYADERSINPPPVQMKFTDVTIAWAGQHTTIPLGPPALEAAADTQAYIDDLRTRAAVFAAERPNVTAPPPALIEPVTAGPTAFVTTIGGRTLISAPATAADHSRMPTVESIANQHLLWMHGRFVGAEVPNRNGALWSSGDLEMGRASVVNGPLNWLHEATHVIGTLAKADYIAPTSSTGQQAGAEFTQPHLTATAAIWRWIWPDEAYVIEQASEQGQLWYSMECISREVQCTGENGCGESASYANYMAGAACEHLVQRASVRRFVDPVFLGGAVIVPPVRPGWAEADATVMTQAAGLAEAAFEQAGRPDVPASEWEQMMGQLVRFAST